MSHTALSIGQKPVSVRLRMAGTTASAIASMPWARSVSRAGTLISGA